MPSGLMRYGDHELETYYVPLLKGSAVVAARGVREVRQTGRMERATQSITE